MSDDEESDFGFEPESGLVRLSALLPLGHSQSKPTNADGASSSSLAVHNGQRSAQRREEDAIETIRTLRELEKTSDASLAPLPYLKAAQQQTKQEKRRAEGADEADKPPTK
jgi:hypothetical protein